MMLLIAVAGFMATCSAAVLFAYLWYSGFGEQEFVSDMFDVEDRISDGGDCSECGASWAADVVSAGPGNTLMQHEYTCRYAMWSDR